MRAGKVERHDAPIASSTQGNSSAHHRRRVNCGAQELATHQSHGTSSGLRWWLKVTHNGSQQRRCHDCANNDT